MNGFRGKLRRFKQAWMAQPERPGRRAPAPIGFLCNADDTPRGWADDGAAHALRDAMPAPALPRFREMATAEPARRAA